MHSEAPIDENIAINEIGRKKQQLCAFQKTLIDPLEYIKSGDQTICKRGEKQLIV